MRSIVLFVTKVNVSKEHSAAKVKTMPIIMSVSITRLYTRCYTDMQQLG